MKHQFRVISSCPCPSNLAPYIYIVLKDARASALSIYRGADAEKLLNHLGKHSQAQLYWLSEHGTPSQRRAAGLPEGGGGVDRPGHSSHEQLSDSVVYRHIPTGMMLPWWGVGFDVDPAKADSIIGAARRHNWQLFRPYSSGVELHHLNFKVEPKPHSRMMAIRVKALRLTLPRR